MQHGKNYLVHCGDWHTFVGKFVRFVSPSIAEFESVSKIRETRNGDNWNKLASGDQSARDACDYQHYTTPTFLPISIAVFEWVGELPRR
jgi:uncharacterized protein (DUF1330 family)